MNSKITQIKDIQQALDIVRTKRVPLWSSDNKNTKIKFRNRLIQYTVLEMTKRTVPVTGIWSNGMTAKFDFKVNGIAYKNIHSDIGSSVKLYGQIRKFIMKQPNLYR